MVSVEVECKKYYRPDQTQFPNFFFYKHVSGSPFMQPCTPILDLYYPGENWNLVDDILIKVSTSKFKDSIKSNASSSSDEVDKALGLGLVTYESGLDIPLYWAAYVLED